MSPRVRIVQLSAPVLAALACGDLVRANTAGPVHLSAWFTGPECRGVWRMRSHQVQQDPAAAGWVTGVVWDVEREVSVGRAGFHGPPDPTGMLEIGYAVDPDHRRRGFARAALEVLLARAARESLARTVRVSISPDNTASAQLVLQYGFVPTGEQWDAEDGWEIVYEVAAQAWTTAGRGGRA